MGKPLLPDELWAKIQPLLPPPKPRRDIFPGRRPLDRRKVLTGILFVLRTGLRWNDLPAELAKWAPGTRIHLVYLVHTNLGWMPQKTSVILGVGD